jgi:hypothetical protein
MAVASSTLKVREVLDAMESITSESDRWNLADTLSRKIPSGQQDSTSGVSFSDIMDEATKAGVAGKLNATTLRLYRDTANRWPSNKRVAGVSFSAHREAMVLKDKDGNDLPVDDQAKLLEDLIKSEGSPDKVTVASVRRVIRAKTGKGAATPQATSKRVTETLEDLKKGGADLIKSIRPDTSSADLDKIHAGLNKVIGHVEKLRVKAASKAKTAKASTAPTPITSARKAPAKAAGGAGDLRGL